jgi:hypothetical protein
MILGWPVVTDRARGTRTKDENDGFAPQKLALVLVIFGRGRVHLCPLSRYRTKRLSMSKLQAWISFFGKLKDLVLQTHST